MLINSRILSAATHFPAEPTPIKQVEERILRESEAMKLPVRSIARLTGVRQVFHRPGQENVSDLAVRAAQTALDRAGLRADQVDLLIFASASQDLIEPATSHIISHKLDASCPVFDVKNACNSFLNGIQVADMFIRTGVHKTVLVVTGEMPSVSIRWNCRTREEFTKSFAGFSMSDSGGAVVLQAEENAERSGVLSVDMTAHSEMWDVGILETGGSRAPRDPEASYFNMNGHALYEAFRTVGCDMLYARIREKSLNWNDFDTIGMHQVSSIYNDMLIDTLSLPREKTLLTIQEYGNLASNSLPLQLEKAIYDNLVTPGNLLCFIGLGGGISTGIGMFRL